MLLQGLILAGRWEWEKSLRRAKEDEASGAGYLFNAVRSVILSLSPAFPISDSSSTDGMEAVLPWGLN